MALVYANHFRISGISLISETHTNPENKVVAALSRFYPAQWHSRLPAVQEIAVCPTDLNEAVPLHRG